MKGTKVQNLGVVAGAWPVAWVRGNYYQKKPLSIYMYMCVYN